VIEAGEIHDADLAEAGRRPVLIVSRQSLNRGRYVTIVPFTTSRLAERRRMPTCVFFRAGEFGLTADSVAQCDAIGSVHVGLLDLTREPRGKLDAVSHRSVIQAIGYTIAAACEPL